MATGLRQLRARAVLALPQLTQRPQFDLRAGISRLVPSGRELFVGFALLLAGALAYLIARETPMFAVQKIEVVGAPREVGRHVLAALRPLEGTSLLALQEAAVTRRLAALPDVSDVSYDRAFPHTLRIFVRPETPTAVVRRGPDAWVVSASGRVIRAVAPLGAVSLARIWVAHSVDVRVGERLPDEQGEHALQALALARESGLRIRVRLVQTDGGRLTLVLRSGVELRLGNAAELPLKLAIAGQILPVAGLKRYLDLSVPERPVAG